MRALFSLLWRLRQLVRLRRVDADLQDELAFHLQARADALHAEGWPADAARRQARRELGEPLRIREASREAWVARWIDRLAQDTRYALRSWRRQPGFTLAVVTTLALGIGANTAIFSLVDALLLRPAPFADPSRLVLARASRSAERQAVLPLSFPNFVDLRDRAHAFEAIAGWTMGDATLTGGAVGPEQVQLALVTANFFEVLGVAPRLGRDFRPEEDRAGTAPVAVISDGLFARRFARDPAVLDRIVTIDGGAFRVVGVAAERFRFPAAPHETELWIPFGLDPFTDRRFVRGLNSIFAIARIRDGVSLVDAQNDIAGVAAALERDYPEFNRGRRMHIVPLEAQAQDRVRGALVALSAAVVIVLLIACANVANLLLGRTSARQHELALRRVLGASRRRIGGQLLIEHLMLAFAGGGGGLALAWLTQRVLARLPYNSPDLFTPWVPPVQTVAIDARALLFTFGASLTVGLLAGLLPAGRSRETDRQALASGGTRATGHRRTLRLRAGLIVAEVALASVLLAAMSLMLSSFNRLAGIDTGFSPEGLAALEINLPAARYPTDTAVARFFGDVLDRLRATPGITAAAAVDFVPFGGLDSDTGVLFAGQPIPPPDRRPRAHPRVVSPGYFETMKIAVVEGRTFESRDLAGRRSVVLNESAAREYFPDGRALGRRLALDFEAMRFFPDRPPVFDLESGLREVIGIVRDVRHSGLTSSVQPEFYVPLAQRGARRMSVVVRSALPEPAVLAAVRSVVTSLDPDQPIASAASMPGLIAASMSQPRFNTSVITAFGLLALVLAAIGIYSVMSYFVLLRTREIAIRIAMGAAPGEVLRLVARRMVTLTAAGLALGLPAAAAASAGLARTIEGIVPANASLLVLVAAVLTVIAAAATALPVRRALRIEPAVALRSE